MNSELMFAALSATNEAILRSKNAAELYRRVCDAAVYSGHIRIAAALIPDHSKSLKIVAATSETGCVPQIETSADKESSYGHGLAGRAFRSGGIVVSNNVLDDESLGPWREQAIECGVGATAAVPIILHQRSLGVFLFCFRLPKSITTEIASVLQRLVENVAFALERFESAEKQKQAELAQREAENKEAAVHRMYIALCETNEAIMRAQTRRELFDLVCEAAVLGGHFTSTTIALAQKGDHFLKIVSTRGQNADRVLSTAFSILPNHPQGKGLTGTSFRTKKPCILNDFLSNAGTAHWHKLAERGGTRSGASFPLLRDGEALGVLLFLSSKEGAFTEEIVQLLARLAENVSFAIANFDRAEAKKVAEDRILFLATHDALTGVPNRSTFSTLIAETIRKATPTNRRFAVLFLDLDRFKLINDSLGHSVGDQLLIEATRRIRSCLGGNDVLARFGGDEFMVLLDQSAATESAEAIATRVLEVLRAPMLLDGHECRMGCSIGISLYPEHGKEAEEIIKNADTAMYAAKAEGRNRYRFFAKSLQSACLESFVLETDLARALERGELHLHYQPKVNSDGYMVGVEALLRWRHPKQGDIAPSRFIPIAEESGSILPISRWVIETACRQTMRWQAEGYQSITIAINLSPRQLLDQQLLAFLDRILADTGLSPHLLQLEVTESAVMQNVDRARSMMRAISSRGIRLAIDDFGTGYSSMALMKQFPIDTIKIDRSFVRDLRDSAQDRAVSAAIIALGRAMGLKVIAEGVETHEQDAILKDQNCHEFQGFLFSRPVTAEEISHLLSQPHSLTKAISSPSLIPKGFADANSQAHSLGRPAPSN